MGFFLLKLSWMVFLLLSPSDPLAHAARDSLAAGQFLTVNQTLVSAGGTFTLGFFTPGRSTTRRYAGIWYSSTPEKAVVWVANRESPLTDPSGVLAVMADGSIAILEGGGRALWSSNVSGVPANATALLLDTGNLVLRAGQADVWQSFDHPTDTLLPGMKLRVGRRSGNTGLVSWRDSQDPSPGEFSAGLDPDTYMQVKIWRGEETWLRSFLWSGNLVGAETKREGIITITLYEMNAEEMNLSISINQGSALLRVVLDPGGHVTRLFSRNRSEGWRVLDSHPSDPCDVYNRCGPSGICDSAGSSALCRCLEGFVPKNKGEWEKGEFTGGCVRTVPLGCGEGGEFLRLGRVRPPDRFRLIRNASAGQCETECSRSCNCTAYYFANVPSFRSSTRCLVWTGELVDVRSQDGPGPGFVNVKLASSQFVNHSQRGGSSGKKNILLVVTLSLLASGIFVLLLGILGVCVRKRAGRRGGLKNRCCLICSKAEKRRLRGMKSALGEFQSGESTSDLPVLDFRTVRDATNNFSTANKLGEGGFGPVYKGTLSEGEEIAVKRLSTQSGQGQEEFKNEISLIARLQHKNLVSLVGWCIKGEEKMLIYEFMPNKSLDLFLFDPTRAIKLDWGKRFHIIEGIAQGLLYLHKFSRLTIVHRDLKASNILLDADMNPKISDFGMARIFDSNETQANTRKVAGTIGYMAPEYAVHGLFSIKSDVFSFGVLLLEIVSGKRNVHTPHQSAFSLSLLEYAWELHNEGRELELVDPTLDASCPWQEISRCIHVALLCVQEVAADRPTTTELVAMLSSEGAALPAPKQPAFYTMEKINQESLSSVNDLTLSRIEGR